MANTNKSFNTKTTVRGFRLPTSEPYRSAVAAKLNQTLDACKDYTAEQLNELTARLSREADDDVWEKIHAEFKENSGKSSL